MFCRARIGLDVSGRALNLLKLYGQVQLGNNPSAEDIKRFCKAIKNAKRKGFLSEVSVSTLPAGISVL